MLIKKYGARVSVCVFVLSERAFSSLLQKLKTFDKTHSCLSQANTQLLVCQEALQRAFFDVSVMIEHRLVSSAAAATESQIAADRDRCRDAYLSIFHAQNHFTPIQQRLQTAMSSFRKLQRVVTANIIQTTLKKVAGSNQQELRSGYWIYKGISSEVKTSFNIHSQLFRDIYLLKLESFIKFLQLLKFESDSQSIPSTHIPNDQLASLYQEQQEEQFNLARNVWSGELEERDTFIGQIIASMVGEAVRQTQTTTTILRSIFAAAFVSFAICLVLSTIKTTDKLADLLWQYANLRRRDVELHLLVLQYRLKFLNLHRQDEPSMIAYLQNHMNTDFSFEFDLHAKMIETSSKNNKKVVSNNSRLRRHTTLLLTRWTVCYVVAALFVLAAYLTIGFLNDSMINRSVQELHFFADLQQSIHKIVKHTAVTTMMLQYGSFVKVGDRSPAAMLAFTERAGEESLEALTASLVLLRPRISQRVFSSAARQAIEDLLFSDVCSKQTDSEGAYRSCREAVGASGRHVISLLSSLQRQQQSYLQEYQKIEWFDRESQESLVKSPFLPTLHQETNLQLHLFSNSILERVVEELFSARSQSIGSRLSMAETISSIVNCCLPYFLATLVFVCCSLRIYSATKSDSLIAGQSLFNMLPEVIARNKLISKQLDQMFRGD